MWIVILLSLEGGLYRVQCLEDKKPLLEIRQVSGITINPKLPYLEISQYTLTSHRSHNGSIADSKSVADGQTGEEAEGKKKPMGWHPPAVVVGAS